MGIGSPKPKAYHLRLQGAINGKLGRLDREEYKVLGHVQVRAEEMRDTFEHPDLPSSYEAPPFMSLLRMQPQLPDWNYIGQGLHKFTSKRGQYIVSYMFKVAVKEAVTWWFNDGKVWKCSITSAHIVILFDNTPFLYIHNLFSTV